MPKVLMGPGPLATTSAPGQMSASDKVKLDGITTMIGATSLAAGTSGLVPAPSTGNENNYLRGDGTWNQPVAILTYGVSTYQNFIDAFNTGAIIYCRAPANAEDPTDTNYVRYAALSYANLTSSSPIIEFLYYRARNHSINTLDDETWIYTLNTNSEWSYKHVSVGLRQVVISGDGISTSWSSQVLTLTTSPFTGATSSAAGTGGMVPAPATTDVGKFLCSDGTWATISGSGTPVSVFTGATSQAAGTSGLVPAPTTSDTAKFLRGDGTWATVTGGSSGITGITLASTSLTPDANGVVTISAMTGCSSSTAGTTGIVPAPSSGDQDKFLSGDGTWKSGGLPMVILKYGISTWSDFINAYNNNVIVYCRASSNNDPSQGNQLRMAFMAYVNDEASPTEAEFQYYRSVSSHTSSNMCDQIFIYKLHKTNGWSVTTRYAGLREIINNSTAVSLSYSSNKITITDA